MFRAIDSASLAADLIGMLRALTLVVLFLSVAACRKPQPPVEPVRPPASPELCLERMVKAARGGAWDEVYKLIGQDSRWSHISWFTSLKEACRLVRAHYPEARRARALQRCEAAARHKEAEDYFAAGGGRLPPLDKLARSGKVTRRQGGQGKVTLLVGSTAFDFCPEKVGWAYCGLRAAFHQLKLKSARDLASVKENVELYAR